MNTHDRIELPLLPYPYYTPAYRTVGAVIQEYARAAIKADRKRRGEPEGWQLVPVEPDCDMTQAGVNLALSAMISGAYPWPTYIRDMYKTMLASAPKFGEEE